MSANAIRVLDALGDPTRRLVFKRLRSGARSVGEIAEGMDVSRPAVSQHLKGYRQLVPPWSPGDWKGKLAVYIVAATLVTSAQTRNVCVLAALCSAAVM